MYRIVCVMFCVVFSCDSRGIFDEDSVIKFEPDDEFSQYFGYSVILDSDKLIVGAPKARNRFNTSINSGQVFVCSLKNLNLKRVTCKPLGFNDGVDDMIFKRLNTYEDFFKNDMWFGATIATVPNGKLLMCAPRWTTPYKDKHLLANGACYMVSKRRGTTLFPLAEMNRQAFMTQGARAEYGEYGTHLNLYAYGQSGFSVKVSTNSIIIGAPGILQWTGSIATYKYYKESEYLSLQPTINPYYTLDVGPDDYLGYSVESGIFEANGTTLYVAGAPRSKAGYGQVIIFEPSFRETDPLNIKAKVRGPQLGAYFGASLCCTDIDGDGFSDLLVGAPNYVKVDGGLHYDQGAVFIYLTEQKETSFQLKEAGYVSGSEESGIRFGSAIENLGDIDGDGFNDIAIGAPWEDEGKGAVYIYRGSKEGLKRQHVQKIIVKDARTFGISISGGHDINNDKCNDLAIGAHSTEAAYIYKCIPTMHVDVFIKVPDALNLPEGATNFKALFCIKAAYSKLWPHTKIAFTATIAVDANEHRANIEGDTEYDVSITPGNENCDVQVIEVKSTADLSKPISMKFNLKESNSEGTRHLAKLSDDSVLESSFDIQLMRDCGKDLICKPLLEMTLEPLNGLYIPGTKDKLGIKVTVLNKEEPAFGAKIHLILPSSPKRLPSDCSLEQRSNNTTINVTCNLPAPLNRLKTVEYEIELEYAYEDTEEKELKIIARLNDPLYGDTDIEKVQKELIIMITPKATFSLSGKALPNATIAVTRDKFNEAANVTLMHYYEVTNLGPSDWFRLPVQIIFPEKVKLSSRIKGCSENGSFCEWMLPAKVSIPVQLSLRFDLGIHGEFLEQNNEYNVTTRMIILIAGQNRSAMITTRLVLEQAPPIWPIIVGSVTGVVLLSLIVFGLYKYGFFSRNRLEDFKRLQEQQGTLDEANISSIDLSSSIAEASSAELISDSD